MGEDLGFLDVANWLAGRFLRCKAVEDCLLVELTPDGIPIDDVTSFDMRRGGCCCIDSIQLLHIACADCMLWQVNPNRNLKACCSNAASMIRAAVIAATWHRLSCYQLVVIMM